MSNWKRLESALPEGSNRARVRREERGGWGCHWRRGCPGTPGCPPVDQSEVSIHSVNQSEVSIHLLSSLRPAPAPGPAALLPEAGPHHVGELGEVDIAVTIQVRLPAANQRSVLRSTGPIRDEYCGQQRTNESSPDHVAHLGLAQVLPEHHHGLLDLGSGDQTIPVLKQSYKVVDFFFLQCINTLSSPYRTLWKLGWCLRPGLRESALPPSLSSSSSGTPGSRPSRSCCCPPSRSSSSAPRAWSRTLICEVSTGLLVKKAF